MKPPRWSIIPHAIRKSCDMKTYENHLRESVTSNVIVVFPFVTNVIVQYSKRRQSIYLSYLIWSNLIQSIYLSIYPSIHLSIYGNCYRICIHYMWPSFPGSAICSFRTLGSHSPKSLKLGRLHRSTKNEVLSTSISSSSFKIRSQHAAW